MFYDKAKLIENYSYFLLKKTTYFSHKLTLKTVAKTLYNCLVTSNWKCQTKFIRKKSESPKE